MLTRVAQQAVLYGFESEGVRRYVTTNGELTLDAHDASLFYSSGPGAFCEFRREWVRILVRKYGAGALATGVVLPFVSPAIESYARCVPGDN